MIESVAGSMTAPSAVGGKTGVTAKGAEEEVKKSTPVAKEADTSEVEAENTQVETQAPSSIQESDGQTRETGFDSAESGDDVTQTEPAETGYNANSVPTSGAENDAVGNVINLVA